MAGPGKGIFGKLKAILVNTEESKLKADSILQLLKEGKEAKPTSKFRLFVDKAGEAMPVKAFKVIATYVAMGTALSVLVGKVQADRHMEFVGKKWIELAPARVEWARRLAGLSREERGVYDWP